jgi:hypothetical protein
MQNRGIISNYGVVLKHPSIINSATVCYWPIIFTPDAQYLNVEIKQISRKNLTSLVFGIIFS